jgi:hypothetical protein
MAAAAAGVVATGIFGMIGLLERFWRGILR